MSDAVWKGEAPIPDTPGVEEIEQITVMQAAAVEGLGVEEAEEAAAVEEPAHELGAEGQEMVTEVQNGDALPANGTKGIVVTEDQLGTGISGLRYVP